MDKAYILFSLLFLQWIYAEPTPTSEPTDFPTWQPTNLPTQNNVIEPKDEESDAVIDNETLLNNLKKVKINKKLI